MKKTFLMTHHHKYGVSHFLFKSYKEWEGYAEEDEEHNGIMLSEVCEMLGADVEFDRHDEWIEFTELDTSGLIQI